MSKFTSNEESYKRYIKDISDFDVLTIEEEMDIRERILNGDNKAKDELYYRHLKYVVHLAKRYYTANIKVIDLGDLISEGNIGLLKAIEKFDFTKDNRFMTYAVFYIKNYIIETLKRDQASIKLPLNSDRDDISKYPKVISMNTIFNDSDNEDGEWMMPDTESEIDFEIVDSDNEAIYSLLKELNKDEAKVITMFYGLVGHNEMNLEQISTVMNLSKERVRQIRNRGLMKFRSKSYLLNDLYEKINN